MWQNCANGETPSKESDKGIKKKLAGFYQGFKKEGKRLLKEVKNVFSRPLSPKSKMLLIGETGSGKTSFLNLLCNCGMIQALGCEFNGEVFEQKFHSFNDIELENAAEHQMQSKTSAAKIYEADFGEFKVGIIDTPGFGDSRGMDQDHLNTKSIISCLEGEDYINSVCLVINGRQSRMSANLQYVLTEITSILPRKVLDNVIVVFTNTADPLDLNFDPNELEQFFGRKINNLFYIENPYCRLEKAKMKEDKISHDLIIRSLKKSFEETAQVLNDICSTMKEFEPVHTHQFVTLYDKKEEIEKSVLTLLTEYDNQEEVERKIIEAKEEVKAASRTKKLNKDFRCTQKLVKTVIVKTNGHNTLCGFPNCTSNCHVPCTLPKLFEKEKFLNCVCLRDSSTGTCTRCGHHYKYHYHHEVMYRKEMSTVDFVDEKMRKLFEEAKTNEEREAVLIKKLEAEQALSEKKRQNLSQQLFKKISEFEELGINRNYAKLIENQIAVIDLRIQGTTDQSKCDDLRTTKKELEKKLKAVQH